MKLDLKRLKAERIAAGLTQEEVAQKMGWNRSTYAKRENGMVSLGADELAKLADIFGIDQNRIGIFFKLNVPEREQQKEK